jgi:hypothetical protein
MTVTNTTLRNDYLGNGTNTVYAFTFIVLNQVGQVSDPYTIQVITVDLNGVETVRIQNTDYTVQLGTDGLGTVTFTTAPISNHKITLLSNVPATQETDYIKSGTDKFPAESHEKALDKLTLIAKQFSENFKRTISVPKSSALTDIEFPINPSNANQVVVINSTGDNLTTANLLDIDAAPVSTFATSLLDDTTALQARGTLGLNEVMTTGGVADTYTLTPATPITLYEIKEFTILFNVPNTGASTLNISAVGAVVIKKYNSSFAKIDLEAGDLKGYQKLIYDGIDFIVLNPVKSYLDLKNATTATEAIKGSTLLSKQITIANNVTDANNDIDFSAGNFQFSDGSGQASAIAMTKRLDASWAAGTNQGGLFTGAKAANSTYHCFAIFNPTTLVSDFGFLLGVAATVPDPTSVLPVGFTKFKRIGSILTDGSSNIKNGKFLFGNGFYFFSYDSPTLDVNVTNQGTAAVLYVLPTPLGIKTTSYFNIFVVRGGSGPIMYFSDPNNADLVPSIAVTPLGQLYMGSGDIDRGQWLEIVTNTSSQIRTRWSISDASVNMKIAVTKFLDITN